MNTHIHYLNAIILLSSLCPAGVGTALDFLFSGGQSDQKISAKKLLFLALPLIVFVFIIAVLKKESIFINLGPWIFYFLSIPAALICLSLEYIFNSFLIYIQTRKLPQGITLPSAWQTPLSTLTLLGMILIVIGEEFIFRQILFYILATDYNLHPSWVIIITSTVYGLNHMYFGITNVLAKILSGLVYGLFYTLSGFSIIIPILIHASQNLILLLYQRRAQNE